MLMPLIDWIHAGFFPVSGGVESRVADSWAVPT